jgi:hypothetical protein
MKKLVFLLLSLPFLTPIFSQSLRPKALVTSGGSSTSGSATLSWTVGEPFYTTLKKGSLELNQGEQQPGIPVSLPLNWLSVSGNLNAEKHAVITWKVSETEVMSYSVEKKANTTDYINIGMLPSSGNGTHSYTFTETAPLTGEGIYRIKQIDKSGRFSYSSTIVLRSRSEKTYWLYPNPVASITTLYTNDQALFNNIALLTDPAGKELRRITLQSSTTIDLSAYTPGIYLLKMPDGQVIRLVKTP